LRLSQRFLQSYTWFLIAKFFGFGSALLGSILVVRYLGAGNYGAFAIVLTQIKLVQFAIALGHEITINTYLPEFLSGKSGRCNAARLLRDILFRRIILFIATALIMFFGAPFVSRFFEVADFTRFIRLGIVIIGLEYFTAVFRSIFSASVSLRGVMKLGMCTQGLNLLLIILFLRWDFGIEGLLWATIIPSAVSFIVLGYISAEYFRLPQGESGTEPADLKSVRSYSRTVWLQNVFTYLLGKQTDIYLMGLFKIPLSSVGHYNLAYELREKSGFFMSGTGSFTLSSLSESYAVSGLKGLREGWINLFKICSLSVLPPLLFVLANAREIITILYTREMLESAGMFYLFFLVYIISLLLGSGFSHQCLLVLKRQREILKIQVGCGLVNLALDLVLIPLFGAYGAVAATSFSWLLSSILIAFLFWRRVGFYYPLRFTIRLLPVLAIAVVPTLWINAERVSGLLLEGALFFCIALVFLKIVKLFSDKEKAKLSEINPLVGKVINYF
jgi:O-antigen/teichoic acid export membrane protein